MKKLVSCFFMFSLSISLPVQSIAFGIVHDPWNYTELAATYQKLQSQYQLLEQSYQNAQQQLTQAKQLTTDSEGDYGFGSLLNSSQDLTNREWSPSSWQSTLQGLSGGNPARYQALVNTYKQDHPTLTQTQYQQGSSAANAATYSQDVKTNQAAMVNATYAFNNIQTHLKTINTLSKEIDKAPNTKAAVDLNSRLLAEMAYIQTQELKMQILMNQQAAQQNADVISAKSQAAKFDTLPTQ